MVFDIADDEIALAPPGMLSMVREESCLPKLDEKKAALVEREARHNAVARTGGQHNSR